MTTNKTSSDKSTSKTTTTTTTRRSSPSKPAALARYLEEENVALQAIQALTRNLTATRHLWDTKKQEWNEVPDGPTQVAAARTLLAYTIGEPVKRQEILTGPVPEETPAPEEVKATIEKKIAGFVGQDSVTLPQLLAARKALPGSVVTEKPWTPEEWVAHAKRVHGIEADPD